MAEQIKAAKYLEVSAKTRKGLDKVFKVLSSWPVACVMVNPTNRIGHRSLLIWSNKPGEWQKDQNLLPQFKWRKRKRYDSLSLSSPLPPFFSFFVGLKYYIRGVFWCKFTNINKYPPKNPKNNTQPQRMWLGAEYSAPIKLYKNKPSLPCFTNLLAFWSAW